MAKDEHHILIKSRSELKDELIHAQQQQHAWLSAAVAGFATELIAEQWMNPRNELKRPLVFAASIVSFAGILGDLYHGAHTRRIAHDLNSTTSLHNL